MVHSNHFDHHCWLDGGWYGCGCDIVDVDNLYLLPMAKEEIKYFMKDNKIERP